MTTAGRTAGPTGTTAPTTGGRAIATRTASARVSVVTPFYNTAPYLAECIESVLAQSHGDFEYVLVDNHSDDGGGEIAARYAARDGRIRVARPPTFLGQVPNYNFALAQIAADTRYVKMVQADDMIFPRCLADMIALAEAHPTIGVVSAYRMFGAELQPNGLAHTRTFMTGREACRVVLKDGIYMFGSPTTVMFRADLVRGRVPFYAEGRFFEDAEICFDLLGEHDFGFVHQILTFTRTDNDSLWSGMRAYNGWLLARRNQLAQYGRRVLSPEELEPLWRAREGHYRRFLAEAWLLGAEEGFWKFHEKGLATVGDAIDRGALMRDAARVVARAALSPRRLADLLRRRKRGVDGKRPSERGGK